MVRFTFADGQYEDRRAIMSVRGLRSATGKRPVEIKLLPGGDKTPAAEIVEVEWAKEWYYKDLVNCLSPMCHRNIEFTLKDIIDE